MLSWDHDDDVNIPIQAWSVILTIVKNGSILFQELDFPQITLIWKLGLKAIVDCVALKLSTPVEVQLYMQIYVSIKANGEYILFHA